MARTGVRGILASALTLLFVAWGGGAAPVPARPAPPPAPLPQVVRPAAPGACPEHSLPLIVRRIPTDQRVAYITLDDGYHRDPRILEELRGLHPTLFIPGSVLRKDPAYWRAALDVGARFENHTQTHPMLAGQPFDGQLGEILGGTAAQASIIGTWPTYFRPPFGSMDATTMLAASAAGMRALLLWSMQVRKGRTDVRRALRPGDIVLVHFTPTSLTDIALVRRMLAEAQLQPEPLPECLG